jgi:rubrerythrin
MVTVTSGSEVIEMAIAMERVGQQFYAALAMASESEAIRAFCRTAAIEERAHEETFRRIMKEWTAAARGRGMSPEQAEALTAMVKGRVQPSPSKVAKVAIGGTPQEALRLAISMEQGAIDFYAEMAARLPSDAPMIQRIVDEEMRHLAALRALAGGAV